jgi:hypothetical protein
MLSAAEGYKPPAKVHTKPVENRFRRLNTVSEPTSSGFLVCSSGGFQPGVASTRRGSRGGWTHMLSAAKGYKPPAKAHTPNRLKTGSDA